ncbi:hypothetical protein [Streptomyces sp. RFCAC02]|uniref:hypothetical protein n=1 Tax=Streptomyces sp. RFCAC02 TaxID=2499143 RepID=UPI001F0D0C08|nr:hypothetical protein [Streptomyces sp. RFCAC02]
MYGGWSDFLSDDTRRGELALRFEVAGPGLRQECSIGTDSDPVHLVLQDTRATSVVSEDPMVVSFAVEDSEFAVPAATRCGVLGPLLNGMLGLGGGGTGSISLDAQVALRPYGTES